MSGDDLAQEYDDLSEDDKALVIEYVIGHAPGTLRTALDAVRDVRDGKMPVRAAIALVDGILGRLEPDEIPEDFPVRPLRTGETGKDPMTCGHCGLTWDDAVPTEYTPTPSARCPFEAFHNATN